MSRTIDITIAVLTFTSESESLTRDYYIDRLTTGKFSVSYYDIWLKNFDTYGEASANNAGKG